MISLEDWKRCSTESGDGISDTGTPSKCFLLTSWCTLFLNLMEHREILPLLNGAVSTRRSQSRSEDSANSNVKQLSSLNKMSKVRFMLYPKSPTISQKSKSGVVKVDTYRLSKCCHCARRARRLLLIRHKY